METEATLSFDFDIAEDPSDGVAAETQLDAGMGIPHKAVERRLRERHLH